MIVFSWILELVYWLACKDVDDSIKALRREALRYKMAACLALDRGIIATAHREKKGIRFK